MELGNAERFGNSTKRVLGNDSILCFAKNEADARLIIRVTNKVIDCRKVEVHLSGIFRLKWSHSEASGDRRARQAGSAPYFERHLAAHENKPDAQFHQKLAQVREGEDIRGAQTCAP